MGFKKLSTNKDYFYLKNLQGDIMQVTDDTGNVVVSYSYDDWGYATSITGSQASTIGEQNPFRYRGYYYDSETSLYYLNSRYYDPETGRFISQDSYISTGQGFSGFNMYAYCNDDPVNYVDYSGTDAIAIGGFGAYGAAAAGAVLVAAAPFVGALAVIGVGIYDLVNKYNEYMASQVHTDSEPDEAEQSSSNATSSGSGTNNKSQQNNNKGELGKSKNKVTNKSGNDRLKGDPGDVNIDGYKETHIGADGRAYLERHYTHHSNSILHSNPHDHIIIWDSNGIPDFFIRINYWVGNIIEYIFKNL